VVAYCTMAAVTAQSCAWCRYVSDVTRKGGIQKVASERRHQKGEGSPKSPYQPCWCGLVRLNSMGPLNLVASEAWNASWALNWRADVLMPPS
jgi:hypothetical protein